MSDLVSATSDPEHARTRGQEEEQLRQPPSQRPSDCLQSHFQLSQQRVARPTFSQKWELEGLTEVSFRLLTPSQLDPGWRELLGLLGPALCDELAGAGAGVRVVATPLSHSPSLLHPCLWRGLGFSGEDPNADFLQYVSVSVSARARACVSLALALGS